MDPEVPRLKIKPQDILDRRAYIVLPPEAKIKLCHMAGAPWSDKDPEAKLHELQVQVLSRKEREKIVHGASRLGKSVLGGCEGILQLMLPFTNTAVVASRFLHVGHEFKYIYQGMRKLFRGHQGALIRATYKNRQNYHEYDIETMWGSRCQGYSVDQDEGAQLLGQEFSQVILGEGSHISFDILNTKVMRAIDGALMKRQDGIQRETGYLTIYTTPKGYEGCSAAEWERVMKETQQKPEQLHYGKVPFAQTVWLREANILENPAYDRSVFEARKKTLSKHAFEEQYLGKMSFRTGRIFLEYDEQKHYVPNPSSHVVQKCRLGVGIDTGAYFGAALVGLAPNGHKHVLGEVYTQQQTIVESAEAIKEMVVETLGPVFGVSEYDVLKERIDLWVVDPASQHKLELIELLDITLSHPTRGQGKFELIPTIDQIRQMFRNNELTIGEQCIFLNDQLRKYIWKVTKSAGGSGAARTPVVVEPKKAYDHVVDAMRFITVPLHEMGPLEEAPPPLTRSQFFQNYIDSRLGGELRREMEEAGVERPIVPDLFEG